VPAVSPTRSGRGRKGIDADGTPHVHFVPVAQLVTYCCCNYKRDQVLEQRIRKESNCVEPASDETNSCYRVHRRRA
jgi:hypothetical protein